MSEKSSPESTEAAKPNNGGQSRRRKVMLVLAVMVLCGVCLTAWFWYKSKIEVSTDNAFVVAPVHQVSARVPGHVVNVPLEDNQWVQEGALLLELDDSVYRKKLDRAQAQLEIARNESSGDYLQVNVAAAVMAQEEARLAQAKLDLQRGETLYDKEVIPLQQLEQLRTARDLATGGASEAREKLQKARARLGAEQSGESTAMIAQRSAERDLAQLELSYTRLLAPVAGYVTRKSVETGNNVQAGQPLLTLVELDASWIVANYKESQLTYVEPGQKVTLTVDAYPGKKFSGRVDSIMSGTGAAFSLLPPENATGNYVKVVQRIPVKIVIEPDSDPEHQLRVGMSVVPTIYTGRSLGDVIGHLNPFN